MVQCSPSSAPLESCRRLSHRRESPRPRVPAPLEGTRDGWPVGVQTIVDHVRPRNRRDFAARGGGPHEQGEVSRGNQDRRVSDTPQAMIRKTRYGRKPLDRSALPGVRIVALWILAGSFISFIILFATKAFQDPDFCRSETHLHRMKKLELEHMGSETESLPGEIVEEQEAIEAPPDPPRIGGNVEPEAE